MSYKSSKLSLIAHLLASVLVFGLALECSAQAADLDHDTLTAASSADRFPSSASDLLPELTQLNCTPRCDGKSPVCGKQTDIDTCLAQSSSQGCFWSCD
jgi:hypothetical protein